jgi:hypothetical protein
MSKKIAGETVRSLLGIIFLVMDDWFVADTKVDV